MTRSPSGFVGEDAIHGALFARLLRVRRRRRVAVLQLADADADAQVIQGVEDAVDGRHGGAARDGGGRREL